MPRDAASVPETEPFDYVIVGAGSAGSVLAARLSEDASVRVCLVEAGPPDRSLFIHVPLGVMALMNHRTFNWRYWTTPQLGLAGRQIYIPRGRGLGGSSSINGMVYNRGHPFDYDDWARAGNTGWSYREVLPYFRRSENNETWPDSPYHGAGGPMNVTHLDRYNPLCEALFAAAESMQMRRTDDFCGVEQEGFGIRQVTQRDGRRESAATAYLTPVLRRPNLRVMTGALAHRVTFSGQRASGLLATVGGAARLIPARREVILAAGAIASPLLLMRSGIGPGEELRRRGIAVRHDSPGVGANLQDHITTPIQYSSPTTVPYGLSVKTAPWLAWNVLRYALFRRGLFANNILHAGGFVRTDPALDRPDIQLILMPAARTAKGTMGIGHGYGLITVLLRPESRGRVTLSGAAPDAPPVIDPSFLDDPADLAPLLRGVRLARRLLEAPAFAPYRGEERAPGAAVVSDDSLADYIRAASATAFHPVGTCRMGADDGAVIDPELQVRGVDGLRVVDASIMPTLIGGNTNAPVIMIAEKAADMIRGWKPLAPATGIAVATER
ncbi:MAG: GMC family oxidoreductase [Stellaceae bacterium]